MIRRESRIVCGVKGRRGEGKKMKNLELLFCAGIFGVGAQASAQAPVQPPTQSNPPTAPKAAGTTAKPGATATRPYDRTLLRPALLKEKAPETFQVKFETTPGAFTVTVTPAWAPLGADRFYNLVN